MVRIARGALRTEARARAARATAARARYQPTTRATARAGRVFLRINFNPHRSTTTQPGHCMILVQISPLDRVEVEPTATTVARARPSACVRV